MKNREEREFAEMMKQYAREYGELLMQENERLQQDPGAAVPEDMTRRMLETIRRAFEEKQSG